MQVPYRGNTNNQCHCKNIVDIPTPQGLVHNWWHQAAHVTVKYIKFIPLFYFKLFDLLRLRKPAAHDFTAP